MNFKTIFLLFSLAVFLFPTNTFSQTQEEIEQMVNGEKKKPKQKKTKLKKELSKRKKEISQKEKPEEKQFSKNDKKLNQKKRKKKNSSNIKEAKKLNYNKLKKTGDKLSLKGSHYNALDFYNKALFKAKKDKKKVLMYKKLADANFLLRDYKLAAINYEKALSLNINLKKHPLTTYQLANAYKYLAKYDSAIVTFEKFIEKEKENKNLSPYLRKARRELKGCHFAKNYLNDEPKYKIKNAGENINGPFTDYGPEIVSNKLYFSKINTDKAILLDGNMQEKEFSKIYYSEIKDEDFGLFQDFASNINKNKKHIGNPSFTSDGNVIYFTECDIDAKMQSQCKIYKSERVNNIWQDAVLLNNNINLENTNNTQAQIVDLDNGTQVLYFVSNRARSKGGKDIWYAKIDKEGVFSKAKNIGYPINTSFDEVSPFYSKSTGTLFFSSDGHENFGGLDVFKISKNEEGDWEEKPTNMGLPINSSLDDYDFVLNSTEKGGYLVSNRVGTTSLKSETCCDDIFKVSPTAIDLFVKGMVYVENKTDRKVLENAKLFLYDSETDTVIKEIIYNDAKPYITELEKEKGYKIIAQAEGFKDSEVVFSTIDLIKSDTLFYDLFLKNKELTGHLLSTVYYEFNISKLRSDAPDSLRKVVTFLEAYPDVILEVGSHTDSKGSEKYNLALSERRSLSVKNFLIYQKNISEKRLVHRPYGESQPVEPNMINGKDNPKGRDLNRRTEFKVIGHLKNE